MATTTTTAANAATAAEVSTAASRTLSPCESCITLNPTNLPPLLQQQQQQLYNPQYFNNYLQTRLAEEISNSLEDLNDNARAINKPRAASIQSNRSTSITPKASNSIIKTEITIIYNHHDINIKLSSIISLINSYLTNPLQPSQITINHLFIYLYYHQFVLFEIDETPLKIRQFNLIHLGKPYKFVYDTFPIKNTPTRKSLLLDFKIEEFPKFLLNITGDSQQTLSSPLTTLNYITHPTTRSTTSFSFSKRRPILHYTDYFDIATFLKRSEEFEDKSTGSLTYVEYLRNKLKRKHSTDTTKTIRGNKNDTQEEAEQEAEQEVEQGQIASEDENANIDDESAMIQRHRSASTVTCGGGNVRNLDQIKRFRKRQKIKDAVFKVASKVFVVVFH